MKPLDTAVEIDIFISKFTALLAEGSKKEERKRTNEEEQREEEKRPRQKTLKHGEGKENFH
jgi:hypothetical protein